MLLVAILAFIGLGYSANLKAQGNVVGDVEVVVSGTTVHVFANKANVVLTSALLADKAG